MTTIPRATVTDDEPSPGCDQSDRIRWVTSTPDTDTWACQRCGVEWTIGPSTSTASRLRPGSQMSAAVVVPRDCAANGVFGPTRRAVVRWDGHCE
jgi:hypothetical protein